MTTIHRTPAGLVARRRTAPSRPRSAGAAVHVAIRSAALGAVAFIVAMGWPMPVGTTLVLGCAIVLWVIGNFATEPPDGTTRG